MNRYPIRTGTVSAVATLTLAIVALVLIALLPHTQTTGQFLGLGLVIATALFMGVLLTLESNPPKEYRHEHHHHHLPH